jgi:hypothetical protein
LPVRSRGDEETRETVRRPRSTSAMVNGNGQWQSILISLLFSWLAMANGKPSISDQRAELFVQVELNNIDYVRSWVKKGGDINVQSANGKTALMRACAEEHTDMVKVMISELNADLNVRNKHNLSVIGMLTYQVEIISILLKEESLILTQQDVDNAFNGGEHEIGEMLKKGLAERRRVGEEL